MPHITQGSPDDPETIEDLDPFFRGLFYVSPDGVVVCDEAGVIRLVSDRAAALFGYTPEEMPGRSIDMLVPQTARSRHAGQRSAYLEEPNPRLMGEARDLYGLRKDGSTFAADISLSTITTSEGRYVVAMVRDISYRVRLLHQLRRDQAQLRGANESARAILAGDDVDSVLQLVTGNARGVAGAAMGAILSHDSGRDVLDVLVADGDSGAIGGLEVPMEDSLVGEVIRRGRSIILERSREEWNIGMPHGLGPAMLVPIPAAAKPSCLLTVANHPGGRRFTRNDLGAVESAANQAAVAIDFAAMREELQQLAVMEERDRIAMDLHDGIIQELFGTAMALQSAEAKAAHPAAVRMRLGEASERIDRIITDLRTYIYGLHQARTEQSRLDGLLRHLAAVVQKESGVVIAVDVDSAAATAVQQYADTLRHMAREALSNVARHAGAHSARLSLRYGPGRDVVVLEVDDDGSGFDPLEAAGAGEGLRNLEKRADAAGATLTIESRAEEGTRVRVLIPV